MTPYLPNLPRRIAHLIAFVEIESNGAFAVPPYHFESDELPIDNDEIVIVTVRREKKPSTLPVFRAVETVSVPMVEYV